MFKVTRTPQYPSVDRMEYTVPRPTERQMTYLKLASCITDNVYLCGAPAVKVETLIQYNIKAVINATLEFPPVNHPGVTVLKVPVHDDINSRLAPHFDRCIELIERTKREGGNVLVHCMAGVSRSASICIAYLMKSKRFTLRQAYYHVKERRPIIRPNFGFFRQLIAYEKSLFGCTTVRMVHSPIGVIPDVYEEQLRTMFTPNPRYRSLVR